MSNLFTSAIDLTQARATPHWQLLTRENVAFRQAFPWGRSLQKLLWHTQPRQFSGSNLFVASDYGGEHNGASHLVYAFLATDSGGFTWSRTLRDIRKSLLPDGRRMSFKRLDDAARRNALVPFLQAADELNGHLVVIAVDKKIKWLMTRQGQLSRWKSAYRLQARWNDHSFEDMARKAYIFAIILSLWSQRGMNVCWITDQDQSVANEDRLDDMQQIAARLSSGLLDHSLGEFAMNSTAIDGADRHFEDLCALPDLSAGMVGEICATLPRRSPEYDGEQAEIMERSLSPKTELISNWFWDANSRLQKTLLRIDPFGESCLVQKVEMSICCDECLDRT